MRSGGGAMVRFLLDHGAKVDARDCEGNTALHLAINAKVCAPTTLLGTRANALAHELLLQIACVQSRAADAAARHSQVPVKRLPADTCSL